MDDDTQELKGISDRSAGIAIRWAIAQVSSKNADKRRLPECAGVKSENKCA
ncbi:MAG: hypothetical protein ACYT04_62750 [Nostoc sp.]